MKVRPMRRPVGSVRDGGDKVTEETGSQAHPKIPEAHTVCFLPRGEYAHPVTSVGGEEATFRAIRTQRSGRIHGEFMASRQMIDHSHSADEADLMQHTKKC